MRKPKSYFCFSLTFITSLFLSWSQIVQVATRIFPFDFFLYRSLKCNYGLVYYFNKNFGCFFLLFVYYWVFCRGIPLHAFSHQLFTCAFFFALESSIDSWWLLGQLLVFSLSWQDFWQQLATAFFLQQRENDCQRPSRWLCAKGRTSIPSAFTTTPKWLSDILGQYVFWLGRASVIWKRFLYHAFEPNFHKHSSFRKVYFLKWIYRHI